MLRPTLYSITTLVIFMCTAATAAPTSDSWITGMDTTIPTTGTARPALNAPFVDDVYGRTIRRISEPNEISTSWVRHEYARRQAFNADGTRLIMIGNNGAWMVYTVGSDDRVTLDHKLPSMSEPNWHPTDPDIFWYFPRNGAQTIKQYNVVSRTSTQAADFSGRLPWSGVEHIWTMEEGEPSADGRIWCLAAENADFKAVGMFSYDMETDTILGTAALSGDPNHVSTSPSGDWCVPSGSAIGGTWAYSTDFSVSRQLHGKSEHSDLAIDADGRDVLVYGDYNSGWVTMADLATGAKTQLVDIYEVGGSGYALHISGNNYRKPGYAVLSTYNATTDYGQQDAEYGDIWGHDRLAIFELKADPEIYNVAYMHNKYTTYWTEPHATVDADLSRILYVSNWESGEESQLSTYMVSLEAASGGGGGGGTVGEPQPTTKADYSGLWYREGQSGHGFSIQQIDTARGPELLAYWFTYIDGNPQWILAQGPMSGNSATLDAIVTDGGDFPPLFDPDSVHTTGWGTLRFDFYSDESARVTWNDLSGDFGTGSLDLSRLSRIAQGPEGCLSGAWYDADNPGHGMLVEVLDNGNAVVTWYAYLRGRQTWLQGVAPLVDGAVDLDMLQFTGGSDPQHFNEAEIVSRDWGDLSLSFADSDTMQASWQSSINGYRPGQLQLSRLTTLAGHSCN